jgi:hypothetical protein
MRGLSLWHLIVRLGLASMDYIWELDGILNEEYWNIVPDSTVSSCSWRHIW